MSETNWNQKADYLMQTRGLYLNDDYLEFLVRQVWRLDRPADVIDLGCGFGYMGLKLLPLLPEGSTYTGLDLAEGLLAKGRELFTGTSYPTTFLHADVTRVELGERRYDLAVCHALLLHLTDPKAVLRQMKRCVKPGGLVVCVEPHWTGAMANVHYPGAPQSSYVTLGILQRLYEKDADRTGKDGNIGIKVPVLMDEVGLIQVGCRVSDKVNLLLPHQEPDQKVRVVDAFGAEGLGSAPRDRGAFIEGLIARGLSAAEAQQQYETECAFAAHYADCLVREQMVWAAGMMVSYGRVPMAAE